MAKIGVFLGQPYIDSATPVDNLTFPVFYMLGAAQNFFNAKILINANIETNGEAQIQELIRTAIVASVNAQFGTTFTNRDVRIMDGAPDGFLVSATFQLSSLLAVDDIAVWINTTPVPIRVIRFFAAARLLTSGTATVVVKNAASATVGSIPLTGAAPIFNDVAPIPAPPFTVLAGGRLRFGLSGVGVGLGDVTVGLWYVAPGTAS